MVEACFDEYTRKSPSDTESRVDICAPRVGDTFLLRKVCYIQKSLEANVPAWRFFAKFVRARVEGPIMACAEVSKTVGALRRPAAAEACLSKLSLHLRIDTELRAC